MKQVLTVHILSLNGKAVSGPNTSFIASFYQTTPVQIASVERVAKVKYLHLHTTVTESVADSGDEHVEIDSAHEEKGYTNNVHALSSSRNRESLSDQISELEDLRAQARELAALIKDQELILKEHLSHGSDEKTVTAATSTVALEECHDVRCAYNAMMEKIRNGPEQLCEVGRGWKAFFRCVHGWRQLPTDLPVQLALPGKTVASEAADDEYVDDLGQEFDNVEWVDVYEAGDVDSFYMDYERYLAMRHLHSVSFACCQRRRKQNEANQNMQVRIRMLVLVAETALIFGTALFFVTTLLRRLTIGRRRRQQQDASNDLPRYQGYSYFDEPKTLISLAFLDGGLCEEGAQSLRHNSGYPNEKAILRSTEESIDGQENKSVAEEISQLRAAASVVSDLVAMDAAGRRQAMDDDDEAPPAYDEREHSL